jgi:hypothetical protein
LNGQWRFAFSKRLESPMGIEAIITVVPRSEYRKQPRNRDLPKFELNAWGDLDGSLEAIGKPVSMALRGNKPEYLDSGFVIVTPALARKIGDALTMISHEQLLALIREQRKKHGWPLRKYEHKRILAAFEMLKDAYQMASQQGAYLEILFD